MLDNQCKKIKKKLIAYKVMYRITDLTALGYTLFIVCSISYVNGYNYVVVNNVNCTEMVLNTKLLWSILVLVLVLLVFIKCYTLLIMIRLNEKLRFLKRGNKTCKRNLRKAK